MLDLARVVALLFALGACVRVRYAFGALVGIALAVRLGIEVALPLIDHSAVAASAGSGFAFVFLGPTALPMARSPVAILDLVASHRRGLLAAAGVLASVVALVAFHRARPLRPESDAARGWDRVGLRFLLVAVLEGMLGAFDLLLAHVMTEP